MLEELCLVRCMLKFARLADSSTHDMLLELLELLVLACIATCGFPDVDRLWLTIAYTK